MSAAEVGGMLDDLSPTPSAPVEAKVVRGAFGKGKGLPKARKVDAPTVPEEVVREAQAVIVADLAARRNAQAAPEEDTARERFRRALELERRLEAGDPVTKEQQRKLSFYQSTPEYQSERLLWEGFGDAYFG